MLKKWTKAAALCLALGVAAPSIASAHTYYDRHHHRYVHSYDHHRHYYNNRHTRNCRTGGTVLGVVGGALVGNALTGHSGVGTVAGAAVGGVAGHQIARHNCR